jgi:hypothetical protein
MIAFANLTAGRLQQAVPIRLGDHYSQVVNGQFSFDITGPTNVTIAVERSTNLMSTWQTIATNQLPTGAAWFTNGVSATSEFYRVRIISPY